MGIQGLLPFVKNACRPVNISEFSGAVVAVDGHCWLHRAVYSCAEQLVKGQATTQYVSFCMKMIELLKKHGIRPIIVFDGHSLPAKNGIHKQRTERRELMKQKGEQYEMQGNHKEARQCFGQSYSITPSMVLEVIKACKSAGVDCLVSPFEADAQLTYLLNEGYVHFVITEDSDLIPFGCKRIFFKLDPNGSGLFYERHNLHKCLGNRAKLLLSPGRSSDEMLFTRFRYACILTGCDYYPGGFNGLGLYKASKVVMGCSNIISVDRMLSRLPQYLNNMHLVVTPEFKAKFMRANYTFLYQIVLDPAQRKLVPLHPLPANLDSHKLNFAGHGMLTDTVAFKIAVGAIPVGQNAENSSEEEWRFSQITSSPVDLERQATDGIWSKTYRKPMPFTSPVKTPLVKRRSTLGETVVLDADPIDQMSGASGVELSDLSKNPFTSSCDVNHCKRKLWTNGVENGLLVSPQPLKKRMVSFSAVSTKQTRSLKYRPNTTAKMQLEKQGDVVHSGYFASSDDCLIVERLLELPTNSCKETELKPLSQSVAPDVSQDDDDLEVIISGSTNCKANSHSSEKVRLSAVDAHKKSASLPSMTYQKDCSVNRKVSFGHLAFQKTLSM
ncbi:exonuclease 1-like [Paramacrobiotus metropolitanus]|uniref:exonuclease 1-like n=1 Tax=Paramacrobiotus metropolitanus TaxID=2943436 RepID=UPI0024462968|nr:exonuclease 1-like [Paramacrobiotus metropolitanus]